MLNQSSSEVRSSRTDILIVGAGLAALRAAIEARRSGLRVTMVTKGIAGRAGSSAITSAGFTAAIREADPEDSPKLHYEDTLRGGGDINDRRLVRIFCDEAPDRFWEMVDWGVLFERDPETGRYVQFKSGDHSKARVAVAESHKGTGMTLPLKQAADGVEYLDRIMALDLMVDDQGVSGIVGLDTHDLELVVILAKSVILGTGGIGQLFPVSSNPNDVTGDGLALAYRAGAVLRDIEFVQFYPWRLISYVRSRMPVQPSSFPAGAILRNANGERFMERMDPERKEATTRDFAARGIYSEIVEGRGIDGGVLLDLSETSIETFSRLNPRVAKFFEQKGIDLEAARLILAPEAHYHMGGLRIDEWGLSSMPGLYAVGEVAAGIHGGNRLDSNEIPSGQVFGRRGGIAAAKTAAERAEPQIDSERVTHWQQRVAVLREDTLAPVDVKATKEAVRDTMWRSVGIIRAGRTIEQGVVEADALLARIAASRPSDPAGLPEFIEAENMAQVAALVTRAAAMRTESRSAHYREDFPTRDDAAWLANIDVSRDASTLQPQLTKQPVPDKEPLNTSTSQHS